MQSVLTLARRSIRRGIGSSVSYVVKSFRAKLIVLVLVSVLVPSAVMWFATLPSTETFQTELIRDKFTFVLSNTRKEVKYWYRDRTRELERAVEGGRLRG